jgi:chromosome segregation protein
VGLNIRDNISGDERRRRDEALLNSLREQVDELRLLLRESASRHTTVEEAQRKLEETVGGYATRIDAARAEARGLNEARITEVTRLRGELGEVDQRFSAAAGLIPHLQAQIGEMGTQTRARLQELEKDQHRLGELQVQIDRLPPQVERGVEVAREARDEIVGLRGEIDAVRKDWQKVRDSVGLVEQDVRRRVGDLVTRVQETNERIDHLKEELPLLNAQIDRVRRELHEVLPTFDKLTKSAFDLQESIDRVAALDFERHSQAVKRTDEVRETLEERIRLVERLNDTRFGSTMKRFDETEATDRAIGHRITLLAVRLDELRDQDAAIRLEMRRLEEMRIRVRLEQAQEEAHAFGERLAQIQADFTGDEDEDEL